MPYKKPLKTCNHNFCNEVLAIYDAKLIAGGLFGQAGDISALGIASWDGHTWSALGSGVDFGPVSAISVYNNMLIAGGAFHTMNGVSTNHIASWDGSSWSSLGSGTNAPVEVLSVFGDELIAGGIFASSQGRNDDCILAWNGSTWRSLGLTSIGPTGVYSISTYGGKLVAAGTFQKPGRLEFIEQWDGQAWSPLSPPVDNTVTSLTIFSNKLLAGGVFTHAGGVSANYVAAWDGSTWSALGSGLGRWYEGVYALAVYNNQLVAGGEFSTSGAEVVSRVAHGMGLIGHPFARDRGLMQP